MTPTGKIVFASGRSTDFDIWSLDLSSGTLSQLTRGYNYNEFPRWSPDGSQIVYLSAQEDLIPSVWVMNADGSNKRRLTTKFHCRFPSWAPDGRRILFTANASDPNELDVCEIAATGGEIKTLFKRGGIESDPTWSPDGKAILFSAESQDGQFGPSDRNTEIFEFNVSTHQFKSLTSHPSKDYGPVCSPDGTKIAFISHRNRTTEEEYREKQAAIAEQVQKGDMRAVNEAIRDLHALESDGDVYVMNRDGSGVKQLSDDSKADQSVSWSPCGQYLVYTSTSAKELGAERIKIIDSSTGKRVSLNYDRKPLSREIGAEQLVNATFIQKLLPNFIERRLVDRTFWGEERHPHWTK